MFKLDYRNFEQSLQFGLVIALLLLDILFYIFPGFQPKKQLERVNVDVRIYVNDIPITKQVYQRPVRMRQKLLSLAIPVPSEIEDFPEELTLDMSRTTIGIEGDVPRFTKNVEIQAKPLLEIYPNVKSLKCNGEIKILMLVNVKGIVEQAEVVKNTTGSTACAQEARRAALQSKWIPAKADNKFVTSWVEKTYKFKIP